MSTPKKKVPATPVVTKTLSDITTDIATLQNTTRETIANLGAALLAKKEDLDSLNVQIQEKKAELGDLYGQEKLLAELEVLKEQFEDAKHEHERSLARLNHDAVDKINELTRQHAQAVIVEKQRLEDESRARKIALDDENRTRALNFQEQVRALSDQRAALDKVATELGSFDDRVVKEVAKAASAIKHDCDMKAQIALTASNAEIKILQAESARYKKESEDLAARLARAEQALAQAADRTNAIAIASVNAEAGTKALDELRTIAQKQAESGKR